MRFTTEMLENILSSAKAGLMVGSKPGCPDCDAGRGFHLQAVKPTLPPPRKPTKAQHIRVAKITTRRLNSSGPLPKPPPLTLGPDGLWSPSEPVEER